jgi:hypothetical protein
MRCAKKGVVPGTARRIITTETEQSPREQIRLKADEQLQPPCLNVPGVFRQTVILADVQKTMQSLIFKY